MTLPHQKSGLSKGALTLIGAFLRPHLSQENVFRGALTYHDLCNTNLVATTHVHAKLGLDQ